MLKKLFSHLKQLCQCRHKSDVGWTRVLNGPSFTSLLLRWNSELHLLPGIKSLLLKRSDEVVQVLYVPLDRDHGADPVFTLGSIYHLWPSDPQGACEHITGVTWKNLMFHILDDGYQTFESILCALGKKRKKLGWDILCLMNDQGSDWMWRTAWRKLYP